MRRAQVITNADAGTNDEASVDQAVSVLRAAGIEVVVEATSDTDELAAVIDRTDGREVVVAGGDGSLHAVISELHARDALGTSHIGLVPLGTGNDFARGIGLPLDPAEAASIIVTGHTRPIDLLVDGAGSIVVNAVHVGVGADAGREAESLKPRLGKIGYAVGAVVAGLKTDGHRLRVTADDDLVADGGRRVLQVGIGNGAYVGAGTPLTPDADPGDGKVDVVVSFAVSPLSRLLYAVRLNRGTHGSRDDVQFTRATTVQVSGPDFWSNADGELAGPDTSKTWRVTPGAVTMFAPSPARRS